MKLLQRYSVTVILSLTVLCDGKNLNQEDVEQALVRAKKALTARAEARSTGEQRHTYVKFSGLTRMIGLNSNVNLLAYEDLRSKGFTTDQILETLKEKRPEICTQVPTCNESYPYRSINGTCNNLNSPLWGSVLQPFLRWENVSYSDLFNEPRGGRTKSSLPNPRLVSSTIHPDLILPDPSITNMVPQFGQFLDHDMTLTPEGDEPCCTGSKDIDCWNIQVLSDDPFYSHLTRPQSCLAFTRSTPYCFPTPSGVREQMNMLTAYIDASQVYGSDSERESQLREFSKGRLRVNCMNPNLLPSVHQVEIITGQHIELMGKFLAGDERVNEMPALATMHTLMVREHNRLANQISAKQSVWDDERVYQETRRIVIAEWQNIVYGEYLPVILGQTAMVDHRLALPNNSSQYSKYDPQMDATIRHAFATAAYRFGHTLINGLVRLMKGLQQVGSYKLRDNFFVSKQLTQKTPFGFGYDLILGGLMTQNAQTMDECVTEDLTNFLLRNASSTDDFGSDLVARNIQRGRDHGLPGYGAYRKFCGLTPLTTWDNRPAEINPRIWERISPLYSDPNEIDLFTGGLSEYPVPDGVSGKTFNCLKAKQFFFAKEGDRFFFTHAEQPRPFSPEQLQILRGRTLGDIICENSVVADTPKNVFKGDLNRRIPCTDPGRTRLNMDKFV